MPPKTLLNLPPEVLTEVVKDFDYKEILHLREVCKALNGFVNINQPDFNMNYIQITAITNGIVCNFGVDVTDFDRRRYMKSVVLCDMDPYKWNTLNTILGHQKSTLEIFDLVCSIQENGEDYVKVLEHLKENLSSRKTKLQVKHLRMMVTNQYQVLQILPFLNPKELKKLEFSNTNQFTPGTVKPVLDVDQIKELEQWKKAEEIKTEKMLINARFLDFDTFQKVKIHIPLIFMSDVIILKDKFLQSAPNRDFEIRFEKFNQNRPRAILGLEFKVDSSHHRYPMPGNDDIVLELCIGCEYIGLRHRPKPQEVQQPLIGWGGGVGPIRRRGGLVGGPNRPIALNRDAAERQNIVGQLNFGNLDLPF